MAGEVRKEQGVHALRRLIGGEVKRVIQNNSGLAQGPAGRSGPYWLPGPPGTTFDQTACQAPMRLGGEKNPVRDEAAEIHQADRRGCGVAAHGARAAAGEDPSDRLSHHGVWSGSRP